MRIIVISDTHLKTTDRLLWLHQARVEAIIHAGDYTDPSVVAFLQQQTHFFGVHGNADSDQIKAVLPERQIIVLESYQIGLFHGHGTVRTTAERAFAAFEQDHVDIVIFGHSHQPSISTRNQVIMLNPGSLTAKRKEKWFSYIVLELSPGIISASLQCCAVPF